MNIKFEAINKYFDDFHVLKDVSFEVKSGQIFGYLGGNGAGKTTSLRILMDVFEANSGQITVDGKPFNVEDYKIGYLPEERGMYSKTLIRDQLVYFAMLRGATRKEAIESVENWAERFQISEYLDRKLETLSKGNQQKVQITQAFLNEPDILILDEPFSGLDPVNSQIFQDALSEYISDSKIIIFSSHQMTYVEAFCDDIAIIKKGEIVLSGSLEEIKREKGGNKIRLKSDNLSNEALQVLLESKEIVVERDKKSLILSLPETMTQTELLKVLMGEGVVIGLLSSYEPSLHDIFIETVGEQE
ncbi:ATP-binding cassette domain-containing protein [Erysipelothrix sp. HDW6A]|uniref:ABC transporter ATP-binding protein n=1 Tax=Erysipelothrix sp. HDW6A TaxID=2714928 RepID=UPI0014072215|nr:ATP-binding cassette domain-containing protein [Erysipelothrix sp. HDW6A]QIK56912.1 ATP-binding cassette domain-containing protein [Erysipelothrix sp. HDW6A]